MSCYYIIGIRLNHRTANAAKLQEALTAHGCNIKMRVVCMKQATTIAQTTGSSCCRPAVTKRLLAK